MISTAAATALSMPCGKLQTATRVGSLGVNLSVASVTTPSVPSAPMNILVRSKPALDLRERARVLMISPFAMTTV